MFLLLKTEQAQSVRELFVVNFGFIATADQPPNPGIIRIQNAVTNR